MPRNVERDTQREALRRQCLLESGLKLFSERGIESVKLQEIADDAEVGIATLYKYYQNKVNLVIAISAYMWNKVLEYYRSNMANWKSDSYNAYSMVESYLDLIIHLYKEKPEILRFSGYYKTYMNVFGREMVEQNDHVKSLEPIGELFHNLYEKAQVDNSIRTDINEEEMFTTVTLTMLGMAERYAQGIVWTGHGDNDYTNELLLLKDMMLQWLSNN